MHKDYPSIPAARDLDDLQSRHDVDFVDAAYIALLGRPADDAGLAHYVARLRNGWAKMSLVEDLAESDEGRRYDSRLPGLASALRREAWGRVPLVGALLRWHFGLAGNGHRERLLRASLNQLGALAREHRAAFAEVLVRLEQIAAAADPALCALGDQPSTGAEGGTAGAGTRGLQSPQAPEVREILMRLQIAALEQREGAHAAAD